MLTLVENAVLLEHIALGREKTRGMKKGLRVLMKSHNSFLRWLTSLKRDAYFIRELPLFLNFKIYQDWYLIFYNTHLCSFQYIIPAINQSGEQFSFPPPNENNFSLYHNQINYISILLSTFLPSLNEYKNY